MLLFRLDDRLRPFEDEAWVRLEDDRRFELLPVDALRPPLDERLPRDDDPDWLLEDDPDWLLEDDPLRPREDELD